MDYEVIHETKAMVRLWFSTEGGPSTSGLRYDRACNRHSETPGQKNLPSSPYHLIMGRESRTGYTTLNEADVEGFQFNQIDENRFQ